MLQLILSGDYLNNKFILFSVNISFDNLSFSVFLTADQTQMAIDYDDAFEPVLELKNALSDAGIKYTQKIEFEIEENGSEDFLNHYNDKVEEPWSELNIISLKDTNPEDPRGGNIILESNSGHIFEISTETYDESTNELIKNLSNILKKTGVKIGKI